ncbi:acetoin utilization protein AcuC [Planctomycetota bacterium]
MSKSCVFIHSEELDSGGYPPHCPFNTSRAGKTRRMAAGMGLLAGQGFREEAPQRAAMEELARFHAPDYLDTLKNMRADSVDAKSLALGIGLVDCPAFNGMFDYLALAVGGTLTGARLILKGQADIVFNPSGGFHHAAPASASGFCFINDIVLGAMVFARHGLKVAILDIDVHHGDGVQDAFYARNDILAISLHEDGKTLFPGSGAIYETGIGKGRGYTVNIPFPVETYNGAYYKAFSEIALPALQQFHPDVLVLELGMDALAGDPMAHLNLTNTVYIDIIRDVIHLNVPILATGGGGYNVENTVRAWILAWSVLCDRYEDDLNIGMGGVMMENTDWLGGLKDRELVLEEEKRGFIDANVEAVISEINEQDTPWQFGSSI